MRTTATLDQIIQEFIADLDTRPNTKATYKRYLIIFFRHCDVLGFDKRSLTRATLLKWKEYATRKYSHNTLSNLIIIVKLFFKWCESKNYSDNISNKIKTPAKYKGFAKMPLNQTEIMLLLSSVDIQTIKGKRDFAILRLLVNRGLRLIEVQRSNFGDICNIGDEIGLRIQRKGKTDKSDFIIITGDIYEAIQDYLTTRKDLNEQTPLFTSYSNQNNGQRLTTDSLSRIVTSYLKTAGLKKAKITPHSLRHSAASILIQKGCDIYTLQKLLGHSKTEITELYTQYANDFIKIENSAGKQLDKLFKTPSKEN